MKPSRRHLAVAVAGVVLVILIAGLARLRFDTDVLTLLPADLPAVRALLLHQRYFASSGELFVTVRGEDPDAVEESCRSLADRIRDSRGLARWVIWMPPWEEHPDLAAELVAAAWLNADFAAVDGLVGRLGPERLPAELEAKRHQLATSFSPIGIAQTGYDPLGLLQVPGMPGEKTGSGPRFASDDGRFRIVMVTPMSRLDGYRQAIAWLKSVRSLVDLWKAEDPTRAGLRIQYTGGPAFTAEISEGMERDLTASVLGTAIVIAVLFFWAHRQLRPLLVLVGLLALTLLVTLAVGGLVYGRLNAVSLGFAAILLGLTVDYGLVLHQEAVAHPEADPNHVRRTVGPGVVWAALTTAAAFGSLVFGGLPGLTQLGFLVACGVLVGAGLMLQMLLSARPVGHRPKDRPLTVHLSDRAALGLTGALAGLAVLTLLLRGVPAVDASATPLRPRHSQAYGAMEEMRRLVGGDEPEPWWILATGPDAGTVANQLRTAEAVLSEDRRPARLRTEYDLPTSFWPDPERARENRPKLAALAADRERFERTVLAAGFTAAALRADAVVLDAWRRAGESHDPFWPTNAVSAWTLSQFAARPGESPGLDRYLALGVIHPAADGQASVVRRRLLAAGLLVGGWDLLGRELLGRVESRLAWVGGLLALVWIAALGLTFRSIREVILAAAALMAGIALLVALMAGVGWRWNLMNLMALPLLLGAGTDYAIHLQLALRRHGGDLVEVHRATGRAVFLCAATTVAGFGSLAFSSNEGLASLGSVCAVGLCCIYGVSAHLLPAWWRVLHRRPPGGVPSVGPEPASGPNRPSSLYKVQGWRVATLIAAVIPRRVFGASVAWVALAYAAIIGERRRVVFRNLLPLVNGDVRSAQRAAWRTFAAFGWKLADLWGYESGRAVVGLFDTFTGWEHLQAAQATGRGVLLLTPHLGNWEFGAPLLASRGIRLLVITLAEPGRELTELRQAARARWGIETLVIGEDPFALVAIHQRLAAGAVVAMLVDRPGGMIAADAVLFGRPFRVSSAPVELARSSNCILMPTVIVRTGTGYAAHVLPAIPYERRALGRREARRELSQDILRAFEPWLRQHPEQWFHFVPIWPTAESGKPGGPSAAGAGPARESSQVPLPLRPAS